MAYIRTFNHVISLSAFLEKNNIPYYFFNSFYEYKLPKEPTNLIDNYGKPHFQLDLNSLWSQLPDEFTFGTDRDFERDRLIEEMKSSTAERITMRVAESTSEVAVATEEEINFDDI